MSILDIELFPAGDTKTSQKASAPSQNHLTTHYLIMGG